MTWLQPPSPRELGRVQPFAAGRLHFEQSKRAVEIETLRAQAEMEPLTLLAAELAGLHRGGPAVLDSYLRNVRLRLYEKAESVYLEARR